jgi:hypothetical protein
MAVCGLTIRDVRGGMKSDSVPDYIDIRLWIVVDVEKFARGAGAIHFESLVCRVFLRKTQVMKHRRDVHQFTVISFQVCSGAICRNLWLKSRNDSRFCPMLLQMLG